MTAQVSLLSRGRIKHPSDAVLAADEVEVYVISIDRDNKPGGSFQLGLGFRGGLLFPLKLRAS